MKLILIGFLLILIGILLIAAGFISTAQKGEVRGGGIVMIGPIPVIFGTDPGSLKLLMILAIFLMCLALFLMLFPFR
ncbi:MAG: TIGR00304 family membrane protein [Candidatus Syntropharchaeia archaeon]